MKTLLKLALAAAIVVAIAVALRHTLLKPKPVPVSIYRVARGSVEDTITNSRAGTVTSRVRASLSAELGGRVALLPVKEGDRVSEGALLMQLASDELEAQEELQTRMLETARAGRVEACRAAELGGVELARMLKLAADRIVAEDAVDQAKSRRDMSSASCDAGAARVREAEAALKLARASLAKTAIRAPFAAVVAEVTTELGEWVTPSPSGLQIPPVIELYDPETIHVRAPLDEVDVAKLRAGLPVRITLDAYPERKLDGRVTRVAAFVLDRLEQNRTVEIEVDFDDRDFARALLPGTSADVEVILDRRDSVLRIPSYALLEGGSVLVVEAGTLVSQSVEVGLRNWQFSEVKGGLQGGELVVVSLDRAEVVVGALVEVTAETEK